jgi:hypothetical protein
MRKTVLLVSSVCVLAFTGCRGCEGSVNRVRPSLVVSPVALDFGAVKVSATGTASVQFSATTRADVQIMSMVVEGADGQFFSVPAPPSTVPGLGRITVSLAFSPAEYRAYLATLVVSSDDPDRPLVRVPLVGEGATSVLAVTPTCESTRQCRGQVSLNPLEIDFGQEPLFRVAPLAVTALPQVAIVNEGPVELSVTAVRLEGDDASAFSVAGNVQFPEGGMVFQPGEGVNLALRFVPTSVTQLSYEARLKILSDDFQRPQLTVRLVGTMLPNEKPRVCANITKVTLQGGPAFLDYGGTSDWAPLLTPPSGGYDFRTSRDIRPPSEVTLSALSNPGDATSCTFDPEEGRAGLSYAWTLVEAPAQARPVTLTSAASPQTTLKAQGGEWTLGDYTLKLAVSDASGETTEVLIRFRVERQEDLVVQLSWANFSNVDLDLHLIRPSAVAGSVDVFEGAFAPFDSGASLSTSGDLNGYSATKRAATPSLNFDWGEPGSADDPQLKVDDKGSGTLSEIISLNFPENDPKCVSSACTYKIMIHYFGDLRPLSSPAACMVTGSSCLDGEQCDCASPAQRCVANEAPKNAASLGAGRCFDAPTPTVSVFFKGNPVPAKVIPLETDAQVLSAPCQMWYVADLVWPSKADVLAGAGTAPNVNPRGVDAQGVFTSMSLARYGQRLPNDLRCSPNASLQSLDWYVRENPL